MLSMLASAATAGREEKLKITHSGSHPSQPGSESDFSGNVRIDAPFQGTAPARVGGAMVTFEPSARTAWHTHPLGQTLIVTQGRGWLQEWGGDIQEINQGDIVWIPEGVKHWHGATAQTAMTHIAIAESLNGSPVEWLEKVSDEQYENGK
ncbi:cupin domain-containing protein [Pectobacterium odoriferum]|nr:cupin domain-containing protein [Pectobacterium odoriferum]MCA6963709.1 cupin domain-containing protein [Pectobacterium odoriferum]